MQDAVKNMSVKNLKNTIEQAGLECEGIVDKQDLIELAREALKINDAAATAAAEAPKPTTAPAAAAQVEPTHRAGAAPHAQHAQPPTSHTDVKLSQFILQTYSGITLKNRVAAIDAPGLFVQNQYKCI